MSRKLNLIKKKWNRWINNARVGDKKKWIINNARVGDEVFQSRLKRPRRKKIEFQQLSHNI